MSALSDYLTAHIPAGWSKPDVVRALGDDLDRTTVYRYLAGNHSRNPPEYVLDAFARALPGCSITELRQAAGAAVGEEHPWTPPLEANRLNHAQRAALEAFIRTIVHTDPAQPETAPPTPPQATKPEATKPAATNPDATNPEVTNPEATNPEATNSDVKIQEIRAYITQLRATGQHELAERLTASLHTTNPAPHTTT